MGLNAVFQSHRSGHGQSISLNGSFPQARFWIGSGLLTICELNSRNSSRARSKHTTTEGSPFVGSGQRFGADHLL